MENRTEHFSEEKIYCHTYDGLVREMASAMEVDSQKLFPKTEGEFDYEDIESWIGAVKFKEGKVPDIQASLSSDRGLKVIKFEVADQKGIESLDEKATKEELIYSMALTEAKMKVVLDIAEEVYPAVAFQIKDYRREIERVREEILGDKRENTSLDEVIHGVMSKKTLAAAVIIGGMVLSACGVSIEIVTPNATATETQPRVTETVDIGATETPILDVTPMATEVTPTIEMSPTPENIEYAEIDKRIKDFLGSEGQYSDESLAELPHMGFDREVALEGNYLGILKTVSWIDAQPHFNTEDWSESEATQVFYQGVFLGGVLQNDRVVVFMGMKDREDNRIIVPIGRNVYPEDGNTIANMLTVGNFDGGAWDINNPSDSIEEIFASNADRLFRRYGEVAVFDCLVTPLSGKIRESMTAYGDRTSVKLDEIDGSVPLCRTLFNKVIDVRDGKEVILDETIGSIPIYTDSTFIGISEIVDNPDSDIAYGSITFARP